MSTVEAIALPLILVPAGAEYQAVARALRRVPDAPQVVPIPAGPQAFQRFLATWEARSCEKPASILLLGLGGSLTPQHSVGDAILFEKVWNTVESRSAKAYECDRPLTQWLTQKSGARLGIGITSDHIITAAMEKRQLGDRYQADVVDMESAMLLAALPQARIAVLRIISDDCQSDLPEIGEAIRADGTLRSAALALGFLKRPVAALKFIRSSLQSLKKLEQITLLLFEPLP